MEGRKAGLFLVDKGQSFFWGTKEELFFFRFFGFTPNVCQQMDILKTETMALNRGGKVSLVAQRNPSQDRNSPGGKEFSFANLKLTP